MSGSLTHGGGENVPGIPGACANCNFTYLVRGPWNFISLVIFTPSPLNVPKHWGLLMVISSKLYIALKKQQFIREIRIHISSFPRKTIFRALNKILYFDISSEFCGNHIRPRLVEIVKISFLELNTMRLSVSFVKARCPDSPLRHYAYA